MPFTDLKSADLRAIAGRKAIFFCHSGGQTRMYAGQFEVKAAGVSEPHVMSGGISSLAWSGPAGTSRSAAPGSAVRLFGH